MNVIDRIRDFIDKNRTVGTLTAVVFATLLIQLVAYFALYASGDIDLYHSSLKSLVLPAHIKDLIFQPWSILTWVFFTADFDVLYLATALMMFWGFGKLHQQLLGDFRTRRMIMLGIPTIALITVIASSFFPFAEAPDPLDLTASQETQVDQSQSPVVAGENDEVGIFGQGAIEEESQGSAIEGSIKVSSVFYSPATLMAIAFMLMTACIGLVPEYPVQMFPGFTIKIFWAGVIILLIQIFWSGWSPATISILSGGGLGVLHVLLLKRGTDLTDLVWSYYQDKAPKTRMKVKQGGRKQSDYETQQTVSATAVAISQEDIDQILDKISEQGYNSLSREEKELLFRASQEDNAKK